MNLVKSINNFKEFKNDYFDFKEFQIEGTREELTSFIKEGVRLNFIKEEPKDYKFPCTLSGSRIIHFKIKD